MSQALGADERTTGNAVQAAFARLLGRWLITVPPRPELRRCWERWIEISTAAFWMMSLASWVAEATAVAKAG